MKTSRKKTIFKKKNRITKEKKVKRDDLDDIEKERLRKYEKEGKKVLRHNLDDEKRSI